MTRSMSLSTKRNARVRCAIYTRKSSEEGLGGMPPLGYRVQDRKLVIIDSEAKLVRSIFRRYAELGSVRLGKQQRYRPEVLELALAHYEGSKTRRAYERDEHDLLDERRELMTQWAKFVTEPAPADEVVVSF